MPSRQSLILFFGVSESNLIIKKIRIRKDLHITLLLFTCLLVLQPVQAQVKFTTVVSESAISLRQTFQVQYIIEGAKEVKQLTVPRFNDFRVEEDFDMADMDIMQQDRGSFMRIIVLSPKRSGRFTIPGASAVIDGKSMRSNSMQVVVQQTGLSSANNLNATIEDIDTEVESELQPGEDINEKIRKNFFLRVHASKTICYVGEPLMVVYKAYSRLNANSQVVKRPSLTGFSVLEMVDSYDGKPDIEKLNGVLYYTNIIRKVQLFPLQEGNFVLDPAEIESVIHFVKSAGKKSDLEKILNNPGYQSPDATIIQYRAVLRTEPLTVTVKPLPAAGQPHDFRGAVGNFSLSVQTPPSPIRQGDLVKIQLVISGSGNLSLLTPPEIEWPVGVDTAEPVVKENINKYAFPLTGSKMFEYSFAAPDTGDYIIPAIAMPYYDPVDKGYKTATTAPVTLHVLESRDKDGLKQSLDAITGSGISSIPRHYYFFALVVLLITTWIVYQATYLRRKKPVAATVAVSAVTELPEARKPTAVELLAGARLALQQEDKSLFYHEIQESLWKVVTDRCEVLPSALNKQNVTARLQQKGVQQAVIQNMILVLDECEWALYAPDQSPHDLDRLLSKTEEVLNRLITV